MANTLKLEIVTPESKTYSEEVEMVTLPAAEGEMGVLPQHVPLMTQIVPGEIIVRKDGRDYFLAVGEGFVEITAGRVAIMTDMAIRAFAIHLQANNSDFISHAGLSNVSHHREFVAQFPNERLTNQLGRVHEPQSPLFRAVRTGRFSLFIAF